MYRASNINKTSPRIFNIIENQVLVYQYYNTKRLLQYSGSLSESCQVRSKEVDSLYIKANYAVNKL